MTHSPDISEVAWAITKIQIKRLTAKRDEEGEDGRRYASYASVLKTLSAWLMSEQLSVVMFSGVAEVITTIVHRPTGQFIAERTTCEMRADGGRAYGPRHVLMLAFGVVEAKEKKPKRRVTTATCAGDVHAVVRLADGVSMLLSHDTVQAFRDCRLNGAQITLLCNSGKSEDEMIAEARRLGGKS